MRYDKENRKMKISEKCFRRTNMVLCLFPLIYVIFSDTFNVHINKYVKFLGVVIICTVSMLFGIGYHLTNKPIRKKDSISLIFGNLIIVIVLIWWYIRFIY